MKKLAKISAGVIVWLVLAMLLVSVVFFEDFYNSRYSANNSNARVVSVVIGDALENRQLVIGSGDAVIYGRTDQSTFIIDKLNNEKVDIKFISSADMGVVYWAVSVRDNKVQSAWVCNKNIIEESLLKPYEPGDQRNYNAVYGNGFIGYYENN